MLFPKNTPKALLRRSLRQPFAPSYLALLAVMAFCIGVAPVVSGQDALQPPEEPEIAPASDEGEQALAGFKTPDNLQGNLFAAEPMLANPVAIDVDYQGRLFVCETFRQQNGVEDNRSHAKWLNDDLAAQSVEDRLAYIKKHLGESAIDYTKKDDRIRILYDEDGDGKADRAEVFASGFNTILSGTGAGVLSYNGAVYYTCIPDLWQLKDTDGDGQADTRDSLHTGYGVRFAFRGHDMHGLIVGPDGRLYFSIGDRGYNVTTSDGTIHDPASGAVFRCELDGSNLEVFATGLRNPQELAFDDFGNLFTGDNNSDSGDKARFVYVVPGSDTGWRMYYQYLNDRGPFNREKIWHPFHEGQPAYIVPPITNISDGPSGLTFYPGTGLGDEFKGRFLLCDFRGQASNSGIRTFRVEQDGAFFELVDDEQPFWNMLVTDATFGPDGSLYLSDWVHGWEGLNKGRVYRFTAKDEQIREQGAATAKLLQEGIASADVTGLGNLLSHADQRVRREAQFELVRRQQGKMLASVALESSSTLARLHSIWGLGQLARKGQSLDLARRTVVQLLSTNDSEVRAQACRLAADCKDAELTARILPLLQDANPRARYFAAQALADMEAAGVLEAISEMLHENADEDPVLRHGGVMALANCVDSQTLATLTEHHSKHVRLAAVVALRKQESPLVSSFLSDADELVVVESARAIHDLPLESEFGKLGALIETAMVNDALARRVLNANFRVGGKAQAEALVQYVTSPTNDPTLRMETLKKLGEWTEPSDLDWVLGDWRPLEDRPSELITDTFQKNIAALLASGGDIAKESANIAARFGISETQPYLRKLVADESQSAKSRADALFALRALGDESLESMSRELVEDQQPKVRAAALDILSQYDADEAITQIREALRSGTMIERQAAILLAGRFQSEEWKRLQVQIVSAYVEGEIPLDSHLEVKEMIKEAEYPKLQMELESNVEPDSNDSLSEYAFALTGGNPELGASIFYDRRELSCVRCHRVGDRGGEVGPELTLIGKDKKADYLLEAIVLPNQSIAKGFETSLVITLDGLVVTGIVKNESDDELALMTAEGETVVIKQDDIDEVTKGDSSMPNDLAKQMTARELRDLVAFLSSLDKPIEGSGAHGESSE